MLRFAPPRTPARFVLPHAGLTALAGSGATADTARLGFIYALKLFAAGVAAAAPVVRDYVPPAAPPSA